MSSLAAVQADGYYYPPDWTPDGGSASLRARVGTKGAKGALGSKNAKLKPKQPTIRFEMPFDVGCSLCDATIGKGVRFNAKEDCGREVPQHDRVGVRDEDRVLRERSRDKN
jgi:coiled-coil domain-containing protein 130